MIFVKCDVSNTKSHTEAVYCGIYSLSLASVSIVYLQQLNYG